MMFKKPEVRCPLTKEACWERGCHWYIHLRGMHPQSGQEIDEYGCAVPYLVVVTLEGNKETRQTAGAVESFRNEMARANAQVLSPLRLEGK